MRSTRRRPAGGRVRSFFLILALLASALAALPAAAAVSNGILAPAADTTVSGVAAVTGVADRPNFAKWQLDLLPGGNAQQATFVALGETPVTAPAKLADLDTTRFPNGAYALRLRVVARDGNYDETFSAITIDNRPHPSQGALAPSSSLPAVPGMPSPRGWATRLGLAHYTPDGKPILYLTFDDGPSPTLTPKIVDLLAQYDAGATFFVIGVHVRRSPQSLRPVAEAGHVIANHSFAHKSLAGKSEEAFDKELKATEDIVQQAVGDLLPAGTRLSYLRPPGGATDANTGVYAANLGYKVVNWDIDPKDWQRPGAAAISSWVLKRAFPGAIVVLHDGGGGSMQTVEAVETILAELSQQGYVFRALAPGGP